MALADAQITIRATGTGKFNSAIQRIEKTMRRLQATMKRVAFTAAIMLTAVGGAMVGFLKKAAEAEETLSKFKAVFKGQTAAAELWVQDTAKLLNRSTTDLRDYMARLQDTFVPMGFAREQARLLSQQITQLGVDLASFTNESDPDTIKSLTSALVGNVETVRKYGIIINEAKIQLELLRAGVRKTNKEASDQEKIMARLAIIMKGTADAQGDAERTAESLTNQFKGLLATTKATAEILGAALIPVALELIEIVKPIAESVGEWVAQNAELVASLAKWVTGILAVTAAVAALIIPLAAIGLIIPKMLIGLSILGGLFARIGGAATIAAVQMDGYAAAATAAAAAATTLNIAAVATVPSLMAMSNATLLLTTSMRALPAPIMAVTGSTALMVTGMAAIPIRTAAAATGLFSFAGAAAAAAGAISLLVAGLAIFTLAAVIGGVIAMTGRVRDLEKALGDSTDRSWEMGAAFQAVQVAKKNLFAPLASKGDTPLSRLTAERDMIDAKAEAQLKVVNAIERELAAAITLSESRSQFEQEFIVDPFQISRENLSRMLERIKRRLNEVEDALEDADQALTDFANAAPTDAEIAFTAAVEKTEAALKIQAATLGMASTMANIYRLTVDPLTGELLELTDAQWREVSALQALAQETETAATAYKRQESAAAGLQSQLSSLDDELAKLRGASDDDLELSKAREAVSAGDISVADFIALQSLLKQRASEEANAALDEEAATLKETLETAKDRLAVELDRINVLRKATKLEVGEANLLRGLAGQRAQEALRGSSRVGQVETASQVFNRIQAAAARGRDPEIQRAVAMAKDVKNTSKSSAMMATATQKSLGLLTSIAVSVKKPTVAVAG